MSSSNSLLKDAVFWVSIATITAGLIKYVISYMLKSKCSDFNMCWGFIKVKRDIAIERDIEIAEIENGVHNRDDTITEEPVIERPTAPSRRPSN